MKTITAQDVEDRLRQAEDTFAQAYDAADLTYLATLRNGSYPAISEDEARQWDEVATTAKAVETWRRVADRVRAGGDPLLCVMGRE